MNDNIVCPECNSQDVQVINKDITEVTEKSGCGRTLGGCLFFPLLFFIPKKANVKTQTYTYYACRSCGKEFHNN